MIAKFPGTCIHCNSKTKAGIDEYDPSTRESYHSDCRENGEPSAEQFALAARLGFIGPGEAIPASWKVWHLSFPDSGETTRRTGPDSRERNRTLFGT